MHVLRTELMTVKCEHCNTISGTQDTNDFREVANTYPPTVYFVCPECLNESKVGVMPDRLQSHLVTKIAVERGYPLDGRFSSGEGVRIN